MRLLEEFLVKFATFGPDSLPETKCMQTTGQVYSPTFYEKCFNRQLSNRHLPFHIKITFVLGAMIFYRLTSPTFCVVLCCVVLHPR